MSADEMDTPVELHGPEDGGWYSTRVMDWIGLCDRLRDPDVRGYLILRSLVIEKFKNPVRKVTLATLCQLIPGPNGKDSSLTRVRGILDALSAVGLISTPDHHPIKTSSRPSAAGKPLRIRINDMPAEGYRGWRNAEVKLAAIQAKTAAKAADEPGRNSDPEPEHDAASEGAGRNSNPPGRNSDPRGQNSDPDPGGDLPKRELPLVPTLGSPTGGEAPSARSALGARSASPTGSGAAGEGGSAASNNSDPQPGKDNGAPAEEAGGPAKDRKAGHTRAQLEQARAVCAFFPLELRVQLVPVLTDAILAALAGDVPGAERTVEQLGARIAQRWAHHGYVQKFYAGELTRPVGAAVAMVRPLAAGDRYGCADPRCEAGVSVDTGEECRACVQRIADRRAQRAAGQAGSAPDPEPAEAPVPAPRPSMPKWWDCEQCGLPGQGETPPGGLCAACRPASVAQEPAAAGAPF